MQLTLIKNPDTSKAIQYKIARTVYAETQGGSLSAVEALTSMIQNIAAVSGEPFEKIISDNKLFKSLNKESSNHEYTKVKPNERGFQMCLRVAVRMLHGNLPDCCYGATKFHHDYDIPSWAMSRGYIADIDGLLFYL